jgi:hypothetical protein
MPLRHIVQIKLLVGELAQIFSSKFWTNFDNMVWRQKTRISTKSYVDKGNEFRQKVASTKKMKFRQNVKTTKKPIFHQMLCQHTKKTKFRQKVASTKETKFWRNVTSTKKRIST